MNKASTFRCSEKLAEVERLFVLHIVAHQRAEVVSVDIDGGQRLIGVAIAHVCEAPFGLGTLFHHIVPSEYFVLAIVVEQVKRRSREAQHARVDFLKFVNHVFPDVGLCAFMGFVNNDEVPRCIEYGGVFHELSPHLFRSAQVLHGGEIDVADGSRGGPFFQRVEAFALVARAIQEVGAVVENLVEVFKPSFIDHGPVGQD